MRPTPAAFRKQTVDRLRNCVIIGLSVLIVCSLAFSIVKNGVQRRTLGIVPSWEAEDNDTVVITRESMYDQPFPRVRADKVKQEAIKEAFMHAWNGYSELCFGMDMLKPMSGKCGNDLGGLTIIDSLSTMIIMGLTEPLEKCRLYIQKEFAVKGNWSLFEFIIRYLGGLLSAAELSGDDVYKDAAIAVGYTILPLIQAKKGFYTSKFAINMTSYRTIGQATYPKKSVKSKRYDLAEVGSFQLEFLTLAKLTGDSAFIDVALDVYRGLWSKSAAGLISPDIAGSADSYYEYIIKSYLITGGVSKAMLTKYLSVATDIKTKLMAKTDRSNMTVFGRKKRGTLTMNHLSTFVGGMFAVGSVKGNVNAARDLEIADEVATTVWKVYKQFETGVMGEVTGYSVGENATKEVWAVQPNYFLRPESIESVYMIWKFTGLQKYRDFAWDMFMGINKSCRVANGYAAVSKVNATNATNIDQMESFFLAETLKYLYLTFSDSDVLSPNEWVFNTEAHPLKIWDDRTIQRFIDPITSLTVKGVQAVPDAPLGSHRPHPPDRPRTAPVIGGEKSGIFKPRHVSPRERLIRQ